jgi:uncharacterized membrane protein YagU involved in acid resistance
MSDPMEAAARGALGGAAGGAVMYVMKQVVAPKVLPQEMRREGFAPKQFVQWAETEAGHPDALTSRQEDTAAMLGHLAYSAGLGALYGVARREVDSGPAPVAGAIFGLAVWAVSFEGWMPGLGVMPATTDLPPKKRAPDIMGHVIYGVAMALVHDALERAHE